MCDFCRSSECVKHPLVCQKDTAVDNYFKEKPSKISLRERSEKFFHEVCEYDNEPFIRAIEYFAREMFDAGASHGRNEALEEAGRLAWFAPEGDCPTDIASKIRALKSTDTETLAVEGKTK